MYAELIEGNIVTPDGIMKGQIAYEDGVIKAIEKSGLKAERRKTLSEW